MATESTEAHGKILNGKGELFKCVFLFPLPGPLPEGEGEVNGKAEVKKYMVRITHPTFGGFYYGHT